MRKGPDGDYDKRNTSVVICDTDTPLKLIVIFIVHIIDDDFAMLIVHTIKSYNNLDSEI